MKLSDIILAALNEQLKNNPEYEYKRGLCGTILQMCANKVLPADAIQIFEKAVYEYMTNTDCVYIRSLLMYRFHPDIYALSNSNWEDYARASVRLGSPLWWNFYIWWVWDLKRKGM